MKKSIIRSLFILPVMIGANSAQAQLKTVVMKPQSIFTPKSFDSNDNAQLVVAGAFTGFCMKVGATEHQVDLISKKITIQQSVLVNGDCADLEMYIPYSKVIDLGALPSGNYDVLALTEDGTYEKKAVLPISNAVASTSGTSDERFYAPVTSVSFSVKNSSLNPLLTVSGYFTNSCLDLDSVQISYKSNDVLEVLPLVKVARSGCKAITKSFSKTIELSAFPQADTLIHVRSMNGQSLNKVITNLDRI
jgi:hypothetical protein